MTSVLTPEETEALRADMQDTPVAPEAQGSPLISGERSLRKKLPILKKPLDVFVERLRIYVSKMLRTPTTIVQHEFKALSAAGIALAVPSLSALGQMHWSNLGCVGFIGMNQALSFALIELAYGAPASQLVNFSVTTQRDRLTEVERQTVVPHLQILSRQLAAVMPEKVVGTDSVLAMGFPVQIDPSVIVEGAVSMSFSFKLGTTEGVITMILLAHVLEHLNDVHPTGGSQSAQMLVEHIEQTSVMVTAILGSTKVSLAQMMSLAEGDLVWLECTQTDHLQVYVEQSIKFLGQPIARNGALGVEIVERLS